MNQNQFRGFSPEALQFLRDIKLHNSKTWYEEQKPNYRRLLLIPFQNLVSDLSGFMLNIDPYFITTPAVDKTISRIYRDTRFSKDKSLYRDSMWLTFKRATTDWKEAPAYFFEITPQTYRYGMGFYNAPKTYMDKFRERIAARPDEFLKVVSFLDTSKLITLKGERYQKDRGGDQPEKVRDWFQYKSFYLTSEHMIDRVLFRGELVQELKTGFGAMTPLYKYLWELL
ncbi:MAG: DUF2461 domain-containing protein [Bacteroidota bacterium]